MFYLAYLLYLTVILLLSRLPLILILKKSAAIIFFVVLISGFIPFIRHTINEAALLTILHSVKIYRSGLLIFTNILFRSFIDITALLILVSTNSFTMLLRGFMELKVPRVIVNMLYVTYRYFYVILQEAVTMKRAVISRGYSGNWIWHSGVLGKIIGSLFLRSYERSERIYYAMLSRGYSGTMFAKKSQPLKISDWIFLSVSIPFLVVVRLFL